MKINKPKSKRVEFIKGDVCDPVAGITRANKAFGYEPKWRFEQGLEKHRSGTQNQVKRFLKGVWN